MNVKLLRKVKRHILEEPRRYDQRVVCDPSSVAPCGTVACIGGWAYVLGTKIDKSGDWRDVDLDDAAELLGLSPEQGNRLFADSSVVDTYEGEPDWGWPEKFWARYAKAKSARGRAKIAAERIEHFIKTKGRE